MAEEQVTTATQTSPEPIVPQNAEDINKMSLGDLEKFVGSDIVNGTSPAGTGDPDAQPQQTQNSPWMELDVGDTKLKFKSEEEFRKSFANTHKVLKNQKQIIDKYNAERGRAGKVAKEYDLAMQQIQTLQQQIQQLQQGQQQAAQGRQPNTAFQNSLQSLQTQNPTQDSNALVSNEIAALKNELAQIKQGFTAKEEEIQVQGGVRSMFDEIKTFTKAHPELDTSVPFDQLDDLVVENGAEVAQTLMSPEDYQKYQAIEKLMWLYRGTGNPETDPNAVLAIDSSNYSDLEEAYLIYQHRNGNSGFAQGRQSGVEAALKVLDRNAQGAQTLPNSISGKTKNPMTPQEISSLLETTSAQRRADPQLNQRWMDAHAQLGIDLNM
jgi:hypothetical protein